MAHRELVVALSMIIAAAPVLAARPEPIPPTAPAGTPETKYCLRVELTGRIVQAIRCWTREEWAEQGVDVDEDWPREGVRVIG